MHDARCLEASLVAGSPLTFELAVTLTGHHDQAGHRQDAYEWSLRAGISRDMRVDRRVLKLIRRAVSCVRAPNAAERPDLLWRLRETAETPSVPMSMNSLRSTRCSDRDRVAGPLVDVGCWSGECCYGQRPVQGS
jgi:hypothetical protein